MKHLALLGMFASSLNANTDVTSDAVRLEVDSSFHVGEHGVLKKSDNLTRILDDDSGFNRKIDFPTQIVRIKGEIGALKMTCEQVSLYVEKFFGSKIESDRFYYNTLIFCGNDPQTDLALRFSIDSYFDPMTDEAVDYLKDYLKTHNNQMFLGVPFKIESAKGLVVSYNLDAGLLEKPDAPLLVLQHDNASLYFASNYDMMKYFISDLYKNLYSNDPLVVLPFIGRWFFPGTEVVYSRILPKSNYIFVQPERIYLMDEGPKVYTSPLRYYFASQCFIRYPNGRCM